MRKRVTNRKCEGCGTEKNLSVVTLNDGFKKEKVYMCDKCKILFSSRLDRNKF